MYRFNAANLSFYPYSMKSDYEASGTWPENGVDISEFVFADFKLSEPPVGTQLGSDPNGNPCWVPIPPPTPEEILAQTEGRRKSLIAEVDSISVVAWNSMGSEDQTEWVEYRKALVALPESEGYPMGVKWPVKPEMP